MHNSSGFEPFFCDYNEKNETPVFLKCLEF